MNMYISTRAFDVVFRPSARLNANFPWDLTKSAKTYVIASIVYFIGTFLSAIAAYGALLLTALYDSEMPMRIFEKHFLPFMVVASIVSFVVGFGCQLWYLQRQLGKDNLSLRRIVGLNLDSLNGSKWSTLWRGLVTWLLLIAAGLLIDLIPMPVAVDPAADFLRELSGWQLCALAVLVTLGPIFEELIFRGFLYNMTRSSISRDGTTRRVTADVVALIVSAAAFSLIHFNLSGFVAYFVAGAILAESYRRSGSLWVPIIAHMLNNGTAVVLLLLAAP
jgi:membrane protease YdiL (CAAX protease family)